MRFLKCGGKARGQALNERLPGVKADEGTLPALAAIVDRPCQGRRAASRLALDQDRQGGPCGALRQPADPLPLGAGGGSLGLAAKGTDVVCKEPWKRHKAAGRFRESVARCWSGKGKPPVNGAIPPSVGMG